MSVSLLLTATLIVGAETSGEPLDQLMDRWDTECKTITADNADRCVGLNAEIELGLYDLLRKISLNRKPIDRAVLRNAAQANLPALARMGVSLLGVPETPADHVVLLGALDHPVLAVRYIAARNLRSARSPFWKPMEKWWTGWTLASSATGPEESLVPDARPLPSQFAMRSFDGLTYHYFGSNQERAMFTTTASVESLVESFGKTREVMNSMDAMTAQLDAIQPEMDAVTREMEAAGEANDMDRLQKAMERMQQVQAKMGNVSTVTADPMAPSHTVILERHPEEKYPTATVVIQRDAKLNRTVLMFWRQGGWRAS